MVKLVRLTSNDPDAIFDNTFKQELLIKPNSKIALKSLSVAVDNKSLIIDSSNDEITFQLSTTTGERKAKLTHAEYSATTTAILFDDMNKKLNSALDTSLPVDIGVEVKNSVNSKTTKFQIDFNIVSLAEYFNDIVLNKGTITVHTSLPSANNHNFKAPVGANPAPGECFFYNNINICKGGGVFRLKRNTFANSGGRHAIVGFMDTNPDELPNNTTLDINKIIFGVEVFGSLVAADENYRIIKNGVSTPADTGVKCALNDILEIGISKGQLVANVYNAAAKTILNTDIYNFNNLFPVVIFEKNDAVIKFNQVRYTPNPYNKNQVNINPLIDDVEVGAQPPAQGNNIAGNHFLEFEGESLAQFLGFRNSRTPQTGFTLTRRFTIAGDIIFKPNNLSDAFILEMLNIGLDSYDGQTQSRASYLSIIPKDDRDDFIIYDTAYPVYIDINNFQPLTLRNIKCRLLNNDLSPVAMVGLGTIVLLISD